ncbi:uncharacterized protein LOC141528577 isoform X2 [Cotesia typhae]|uniref:uncharacterized protein LOC141528577 isoform X2 n=1 Tax=Cotesia typhae TaxID=2053667 RepID=UPI003D690DCA
MVKKCSVKNCLSGSTAERKRNVELNRRQTTLFQVPKCPDALKNWNLALSQHLLHKNFVCELHFKDDDIIRTFDRINLPNGEVFDLPKERFHLKAGAIPVQEDMIVDHHDARVLDSSNTNPLPMQIVSEEVVINEELDTGCSAGKHMEENSNISDNFSDCRQQMYSSSIVNEIIEDTTSHTGDLELEWQILCEENYRPAAFDDNPGTFSLTTILQALKDQGLPQNWCWSKQSEPQKLLILYYIDSFLKKLKLEVKISNNLIIQITVMETGVTVNYNYSLTSVIHFFNMLQEIEKSQFCSGAGVNNGRCSTRCDGILQSPEKYKRFMKMNRCFSCRSLRKRLLMSSKRKNNDITKRYITIKRKLHVKQKNLHRLKKKNHQLKEKMEQLKHQCAVIKDSVIEEEIADLPEAQKQAVRACFQAAKVKNSKQRRYTIEYLIN